MSNSFSSLVESAAAEHPTPELLLILARETPLLQITPFNIKSGSPIF